MSNINLFEFKIEQDVVNYQKKSLIKILLRYYYSLFRKVFIKNIKINSKQIVVSHVDSIEKYEYLNNYENYLKYKNIPISSYTFIFELVKFPIYLFQFLQIKSKFRNQIFEAYIMSGCVVKFVKYNKIEEVVFFGYDYNLSFLYISLVLKKNNVKVVQYCNSGFLGQHNLVSVDTLYARTKIHQDYMRKRKDIFLAKEIRYLFDYKKVNIQKDSRTRIAVYTSGYYARMKFSFSTSKLLLKGDRAEKFMISTLSEYARNNHDIEIVLFIHLHNKIENIRDAKIEYRDFLSLDNVRLQYENEKSIDTFSYFELGICCMSEIFFDRYERGYKTVIFNPFILDDFIFNSALQNVTLKSEMININQEITNFLNMDRLTFFSLLE